MHCECLRGALLRSRAVESRSKQKKKVAPVGTVAWDGGVVGRVAVGLLVSQKYSVDCS